VQIENDAKLLGKHCGFAIQAVYGGVDYMKQRDALRKGADIIIGTPGRLIDYLKQKIYSLSEIEMLVIDEADRMFDMGFIADLRFILRRLPPFDHRQNLMFSATLNQRVMELAYEFMNLPEKVSVTSERMTADNIEEVLYHVGRKEKFPLLLGLLRRDGMERTMIFINTKREGEYLHDRMNANDFPCRLISGDVAQEKRLRIMGDFKEGKLPILIATDVASRGLHIEGVSHVINYDLPEDCEDYVHRIGRTARAGAEGKAISFADEEGALYLDAIEEYIQHKIPTEWAEDELFVNDFKRVVKPRHKKNIKKDGSSRPRKSNRPFSR
jgi:ATP-dependent RNA helicase RhlB